MTDGGRVCEHGLSASITVDQFVDSLDESGLVSRDELGQFLDGLSPVNQPQDGSRLAEQLVTAGMLTAFQAQAVCERKTKGLVLGDYAIMDKIGQGGMGHVFRAHHRKMDRIVALKVLPPKLMQSSEAVRRFQREVRAAARLNHPNIVTAFDAGEENEIPYLVMEYVEGRTLASVLADHGPMTVDHAVSSILQAARALEYAHGRGVIHRDIKPSNLLLNREGTVKVLDMGLARLEELAGVTGRSGVQTLTVRGQVMGTCDYMAPEQADDPRRVDPRADVYSLGCTFYQLLAGTPPFRRSTSMQTLMAHRQAPIPSLKDVRADVPAALDQVVRRMIAKTPAERQQSMREVIDELRAAVSGAGTPEEFSGTGEQSTLGSSLGNLAHGKHASEQMASTVMEGADVTQNRFAASRSSLVRTAVVSASGELLKLLGVGAGAIIIVVSLSVIVSLVRDEKGSDPQNPSPPPALMAEGESMQAETRLILHWPQSGRRDSELKIDGQVQNISSEVDAADPDLVAIHLKAGKHHLTISRPQSKPFDRSFEIAPGQTITVTPQWNVVP